MELMATYLDAITTLLVKSLPSFLNNAKHVFYITGYFRFPDENNFVSLWMLSPYTPASRTEMVF